MPALGIVLGFIVGAFALDGVRGGLAGALVGFIVALVIRSQSQSIQRKGQAQVPAIAAPGVAAARSPPPSAGDVEESDVGRAVRALHERLDTIELRLGQLEGRPAAGTTSPLDRQDVASPTLADAVIAAAHGEPVIPPSAATAALQREDVTASTVAAVALPSARGTVMLTEPSVAAVAANVAAPNPTDVAAVVPSVNDETAFGAGGQSDGDFVGSSVPPTAMGAVGATVDSAPVSAHSVAPPPNALYAWLTGGNALTRVGVVVLFFGVGFLLRHFAQYLTIPIELRLAGVALFGAALAALGVVLARRRPGYGVSLEGAGAGILYLTTFAAFRYYDVLPANAALVLLPLIAVLTVWLAIRSDSQPLAALAMAGGFLAPFLVGTRTGEPALLFGYFAVLNVAILAVAIVRDWRALNTLGFVFTFALGLFWGRQYYQPEYFSTVEPFLALFFAFYVAIAVLHARGSVAPARAPVDALLVLGVPRVGFALQAAQVRDQPHGAAWSALALAAVYGILHGVLRRHANAGLALLARAFLALAIIFATLAFPFAVDPHWTSAWWALEAAAVYWIGCEQRQGLVRAFAVLLQLAAAVAFAAGGVPPAEVAFLNASFLGALLIALAGLATSFLADRHRERISRLEQRVVPLLFAWGVTWWIAAGIVEVVRQVQDSEGANAGLAWAAGSAALALGLRRPLAWSRLAWFGAALLPVMGIAAYRDWHLARTTLLAHGWLVWPLAWLTHWCVLRALEPRATVNVEEGETPRGGDGFVSNVHAPSVVALVLWAAWETSEWVGRSMPPRTVWLACAAAWPAIAYLAFTLRATRWNRWPVAQHRSAYTLRAGTAIAAVLGFWFCAVNVLSPGTATPLPFVPLANPLDITLLAALAALFAWVRRFVRPTESTLYGWFGAALFLFVNAIVFRTVHHWADVPWRWSALVGSKPLQAALTLAWTATALPLMVAAGRRGIRALWMVGGALLAVVVAKLFLIDLAALSGLPRVVAFLGVGLLLLVIGYVAPLPPAAVDPASPR